MSGFFRPVALGTTPGSSQGQTGFVPWTHPGLLLIVHNASPVCPWFVHVAVQAERVFGSDGSHWERLPLCFCEASTGKHAFDSDCGSKPRWSKPHYADHLAKDPCPPRPQPRHKQMLLCHMVVSGSERLELLSLYHFMCAALWRDGDFHVRESCRVLSFCFGLTSIILGGAPRTEGLARYIQCALCRMGAAQGDWVCPRVPVPIPNIQQLVGISFKERHCEGQSQKGTPLCPSFPWCLVNLCFLSLGISLVFEYLQPFFQEGGACTCCMTSLELKGLDCERKRRRGRRKDESGCTSRESLQSCAYACICVYCNAISSHVMYCNVVSCYVMMCSVYMYVGTHVHIYVRTYVSMYPCIHVCIYVIECAAHMFVCMHVSLSLSFSVCLSISFPLHDNTTFRRVSALSLSLSLYLWCPRESRLVSAQAC